MRTVGGSWQNFIHCLEDQCFTHLWRAFSRVRGAVMRADCIERSKLGTGQRRYTVALLVLPLVSIFANSEHCFVVVLFVCILLSSVLSIYYSTWTSYIKIKISQNIAHVQV